MSEWPGSIERTDDFVAYPAGWFNDVVESLVQTTSMADLGLLHERGYLLPEDLVREGER
jgi:hypothetical protein